MEEQGPSKFMGSLWFTECTLFYLLFRASTILKSEKIVTMWSTNEAIAIPPIGSRGVGAQPLFFNMQNVKI